MTEARFGHMLSCFFVRACSRSREPSGTRNCGQPSKLAPQFRAVRAVGLCTAPITASHAGVDADDIDQLKLVGITAVLNLQSDDDFEYLRIGWSRLHACYFASGVEVRRFPIQDFNDDDLRDKLPQAVQALTELLEGGHTVFVHCSAGVNRSPSVMICYLHWVQGWNLDEAEKQVRRCRSCSPVMEVILLATRDRQRGQQREIRCREEPILQPSPASDRITRWLLIVIGI